MIKDKNELGILVIEDNPGDYTLIEDYLEEQIAAPHIVHVQSFKQAQVALQQAQKQFDVILLDLSLPDKNGEELITDTINLCSECPIIVLSGYSDIEFSIKSLSLGVSDYLIKDDISATSLYKSIIYNIERKKTNIALKESEKRYSDLFHFSPQPMWVFDPATLKFVQVNKAAIDHYGYSRDEFLHMNILDLSPEEDREFFKKETAIKAGNKPNVFEGRFQHYKKSGELIEVELYSNPIIYKDKMLRSVIAIDVTEKILVEHKVTKAIIKTQDDERYEIGSELHDNVCQILATSQICLDMMKSSIHGQDLIWFKKCEEYISLALKEIRSISHRLAPAFFDQSTLEDSFTVLLSTINLNNKYRIKLNFDKAVNDLPLMQDLKFNLYRILQEQLRNIVKYAKATAIEVSLKIQGKNLVLSVADNGVGFDKNTVKRGIGLSNIKRRAELFNGKKEIHTSYGHGCTINVSIPLEEAQVK